jgi:hypothetical protein
LFGPGYFNYDKPLTGFKRGTTRLCVILIMGRENYSKAFGRENFSFLRESFLREIFTCGGY